MLTKKQFRKVLKNALRGLEHESRFLEMLREDESDYDITDEYDEQILNLETPIMEFEIALGKEEFKRLYDCYKRKDWAGMDCKEQRYLRMLYNLGLVEINHTK